LTADCSRSSKGAGEEVGEEGADGHRLVEEWMKKRRTVPTEVGERRKENVKWKSVAPVWVNKHRER